MSIGNGGEFVDLTLGAVETNIDPRLNGCRDGAGQIYTCLFEKKVLNQSEVGKRLFWLTHSMTLCDEGSTVYGY